jgi:nucleoside-diphosphate-sugar epimerase
VETTAVDAAGTTTLLTAARDAGVEKAVVASSAAVYGSDAEIPVREDTTLDCESPSALSKYWTDQLALQYDELHGLEAVVPPPVLQHLRPRPRLRQRLRERHSSIHLAYGCGRPPIVFGDGEQSAISSTSRTWWRRTSSPWSRTSTERCST